MPSEIFGWSIEIRKIWNQLSPQWSEKPKSWKLTLPREVNFLVYPLIQQTDQISFQSKVGRPFARASCPNHKGLAVSEKYLRAVMFRSINPRLKESAHIPDLTWKASFDGSLVSVEDVLIFPWLPSSEEFWLETVDEGSVWEVKAPKGSDSSKLFNGTPANGSTMLLVVSGFEALLFSWGAGSGAAKKSVVVETAGEGAGWEARRSTLICKNPEQSQLARQRI